MLLVKENTVHLKDTATGIVLLIFAQNGADGLYAPMDGNTKHVLSGSII